MPDHDRLTLEIKGRTNSHAFRSVTIQHLPFSSLVNLSIRTVTGTKLGYAIIDRKDLLQAIADLDKGGD